MRRRPTKEEKCKWGWLSRTPAAPFDERALLLLLFTFGSLAPIFRWSKHSSRFYGISAELPAHCTGFIGGPLDLLAISNFSVRTVLFSLLSQTAGNLFELIISANNTFSVWFSATWVAVISAKNHKRQRRKRQSVTAKREKSQTPKVSTTILALHNLT